MNVFSCSKFDTILLFCIMSHNIPWHVVTVCIKQNTENSRKVFEPRKNKCDSPIIQGVILKHATCNIGCRTRPPIDNIDPHLVKALTKA